MSDSIADAEGSRARGQELLKRTLGTLGVEGCPSHHEPPSLPANASLIAELRYIASCMPCGIPTVGQLVDPRAPVAQVLNQAADALEGVKGERDTAVFLLQCAYEWMSPEDDPGLLLQRHVGDFLARVCPNGVPAPDAAPQHS
jgi:hypothetical protein